MRRIRALANDNGIIYLAGRLFDIEHKLQSEALEAAVLQGVHEAAARDGCSVRTRPTFVPFRDAGQEELEVADKTRHLFELDLVRLKRTTLLVAYIDGMAKDEGVCFEIGFAWACGIPILLISTDFFEIEMPSGDISPLDPLLSMAATTVIRRHWLADSDGTFGERLAITRAEVLDGVRSAAVDLLLDGQDPVLAPTIRTPQSGLILADFGGEVFEWQRMLSAQLRQALVDQSKLTVLTARRYDGPPDDGAAADAAAILTAEMLVTCADQDEAPAGTAFLQGAMCALGRPIWMYNSKRTWIRAAGGYRSSRNLMLDYSATRVFRSLAELVDGLRSL